MRQLKDFQWSLIANNCQIFIVYVLRTQELLCFSLCPGYDRSEYEGGREYKW